MTKEKKQVVSKFKKFFSSVGKFFCVIGHWIAKTSIIVYTSVKKFLVKMWRKFCGVVTRTYQDLSRVRWSDRKTVIATTGVVLSFVILFGVYVLIDDFIIAQIFSVIY
jgi:preprotein translocase SecE subunit